MSEVIFETHDRFPKKVFADDELILDFNRQNLNLVRSADGNLVRLSKSDSWICVLVDEDKIKLAREHKSYKKKYWEVNKVPTNKSYNSASIVRSGPVTSDTGAVNIQDATSIKELKQKAVRYGELRAKVVKADGSYFSSATDNQIEEYNQLKKELNE